MLPQYGFRRIIGFDTETALIAAGRLAPELVCLSLYDPQSGASALYGDKQAIPVLLDLLRDPQNLFVGFNAGFDVAVTLEAAAKHGAYLELARAWFQAYADNRVTCGMLREQLFTLADGFLRPAGTKEELPSESHLPKKKRSGFYSLAGCMWRYHRADIGKDKGAGSWRLNYGQLRGLPVSNWPASARNYALADAKEHTDVFLGQLQKWPQEWAADEFEQARGHLALVLQQTYGVRTDAAEVERLQQFAESVMHPLIRKLVQAGYMRAETRKGETVYVEDQKMLRKAVLNAAGALQLDRELIYTPKGNVRTSKDVLEACEQADPLLAELGAAAMIKSTLAKDLPLLRRGVHMPIHTRYNAILETGRVSSSPNVQNPARSSLPCVCGYQDKIGADTCPKCGGYIGNVRRCIVPRPGFVLCSSDWDQVELCTLGQSMIDRIGRSSIADAINAGYDLHCLLAGDLLSCSYEEAVRGRKAKVPLYVDTRQTAKGGNFGFPGMLGPRGFISYVRNYGIKDMTLPRAKEVRTAWFRRWEDMHEYFREKKAHFGGREKHHITLVRGGLRRGSCFITAACNFDFQAPAARGMKASAFRLAREAYSEPDSPYWGARPILSLHDEIIAELPENRAHEAAERQSQIMRETMQTITPNVAIRGCEPALMRRWYKSAETARDSTGRLIPWEPK